MSLFNRKKASLIFTFWFVFLCSSFVLANSTRHEKLDTPEKTVSYFSNTLMNLYKTNKQKYKKNQTIFFQEIDQHLTPIVAFDQISRYIMGKYARKNAQLLPIFEKNFKSTLFKIYGTLLLSIDDTQINIESISSTPDRILKAYKNKEISHIKVSVVLATEKKEIEIFYSMVYVDNQWKLRNIVASGISVAQQFRDQFALLVKKYGKVDYVVNNWSEISSGQK